MGELRSAVDALVALDLDDLDDAALSDLIVELISQGDRITTITHRALRAQDRRTAWNTDGACSQK